MKFYVLAAVLLVISSVMGARAKPADSESAFISLRLECRRAAIQTIHNAKKRKDYVRRCMAVANSVPHLPAFVEPE